MKKILVIHLNAGVEEQSVLFLQDEIHIKRIGCSGNAHRAKELIKTNDGKYDVIALEGLPAYLQLGTVKRKHIAGFALSQLKTKTLIVTGEEIRSGLERWGIILADRAEPGIFSQKRILMVPGLNHSGLAEALSQKGSAVRYADPILYFDLPNFPGVGYRETLEQAALPTLERLQDFSFRKLQPIPKDYNPRHTYEPFKWADIIAGDAGVIRSCAPEKLKDKTIVVEWATEEDLEDFKNRGVKIVVTIMPSLDEEDQLGRWSAAAIEAVLAALRPHRKALLAEDTYLDLLADIEWTPSIKYLKPEEEGINKFAFVIHPLNVRFIHKHPSYRWTKILPNDLVEAFAAYLSPMYLSRITGGKSPTTGQKIEGHLITLAATPRQMMKHDERFTYDRLEKAARMAERKGARIMGLGAFTSVVGDAGITVAHESDIAITSGNSLTVSATLEAAKEALKKMGRTDLTKGKAMIVGATGSIGSVCSRLLAQAIKDVVLVSIEPERLIELKRTIKNETPGAKVVIATRPDQFQGESDLIVSTTSAFGQRVIDITKCKPGVVICDVARPPDISEQEAELRPDVLVIESGEVIIPGEIDFGYDIGLPKGVAYACLAETALLAMDGRFEDYTLGRNITIERVKEIYHLFKKHQFKIAGLRSFGIELTEEMFHEKIALAEKYNSDPELFEKINKEAEEKLAEMPLTSKGVRQSRGFWKKRFLEINHKIGDFIFWLSDRRNKKQILKEEAALGK